MVHGKYLLPVLLAVPMLTMSCRDDSLGGNMLTNVDDSILTEGIVGEVVRSPLMPIAREDDPDNSAPLGGAKIRIQWEAGGPIGNAVSDSSGRFKIRLIPGTYILTPLPVGSDPFPMPPEPQTIVVSDDRITTVRIDYDTGIR